MRDVVGHARVLLGAMLMACSSQGGRDAPPPTVNAPPVVDRDGDELLVDGEPIDRDGPTAGTAVPLDPPPPQTSATVRVIEGRPFLVEGVARLATPARGTGWADAVALDDARLTAAEQKTLVDHFTTWSLAEHASVASFTRFAMQLMALGAPSDLVARALEAAGDEVRHARFGFGVVAALHGTEIAPSRLAMDGALPDVTLDEALRLAVREGMIGETIAALELRVAVDRCSLPALANALATIADEESRHAELAYAFAAWALARSPELAAVVEEEIAAWTAPPLPGCEGLARWGLLDSTERRAVHEQGFALVVRPAAAALVEAHGRPSLRGGHATA